MARVPFDFDDDSPKELVLSPKGRLLEVRWPLLGVSILQTRGGDRQDDYVDLEDVAKNTPGFCQHGMFGYSIDQFSEFFAYDQSGNFSHEIELTFGNVEVTIGRVTPLGIWLFDNYHDDDYLPDWPDLHSIRILGASAEKAETYLLNALITARRSLKVVLTLCPIQWSIPRLEEESTQDEGSVDDPIVHRAAHAIAEIEPLRLFYKGLEEGDPASAFLQFYRVLEYYAALLIQDEGAKLRWDRNLSARGFLIEMLKAAARDERAQLEVGVAFLLDQLPDLVRGAVG